MATRTSLHEEHVDGANARIQSRNGIAWVLPISGSRPIDTVALAAARGITEEQAARSVDLTHRTGYTLAANGVGVVGVGLLALGRRGAAAGAFAAQVGAVAAYFKTRSDVRALGVEAPGLLPHVP